MEMTELEVVWRIVMSQMKHRLKKKKKVEESVAHLVPLKKTHY